MNLEISHVAIVWQRYLPYHVARINKLYTYLHKLGIRVTGIEVASQDDSYGFPEDASDQKHFTYKCCFPRTSYNSLTHDAVYHMVLKVLEEHKPDLVLAPATPFPEGMSSIYYRNLYKKRVIMMDDSWEATDQRGWITTKIKQLIHQNVDGVFIPAPSHNSYYKSLGFPLERIVHGVDVVDNEYFELTAERCRIKPSSHVSSQLPCNFFLYVGRFLPRKGVETLIAAYRRYREQAGGGAWSLVLVGGGPYLDAINTVVANDRTGIHFAGMAHGDYLCEHYGLAKALIVPSVLDPWGLVVNEGMAASLPVLVSSGCGAARTLVRDGENGWVFSPDDTDALAELMLRIAGLPDVSLKSMGARSRAIISEWSLDRFVTGVTQAMSLPRRESGGLLSYWATRLWRGRISVN